MKYKPGQRVKIIVGFQNRRKTVGKIGIVVDVNCVSNCTAACHVKIEGIIDCPQEVELLDELKKESGVSDMVKYYKVIKDTPLWEEGAILSNEKSSDMMKGVEDIWDKHEDMTEYLSPKIVENAPDFFERVYKSEGHKIVYKTAEQLKKVYAGFIGESKKGRPRKS